MFKENLQPNKGTTPAAVNAVIPFIQRQPVQAPAATAQGLSQFITQAQPRKRPTGSISRQEFDNYVRTYYGVGDVHTGTQAEQETRITRNGVPSPSIPSWHQWDPGTSSEDYTSIIDGVEEMIDGLGAMPQINTIIFFEARYEPDPGTGIGIADRDTGASFGAGEMVVYQAFTGSTIPATGISSTAGTPTRPQSRRGNISYNIIHELGHGVGEAGSNNGPGMFRLYNAAIGWIGSPAVLYDVGQPTVRAAIAANTTPPAQHIITSGRWNDASVSEQPMSGYAVSGGPGEDFAETIAAYVTNPSALAQRSPARYNFIHNRIGEWKSRMRSMMPGFIPPPVGDFPERILPEGTEYA